MDREKEKTATLLIAEDSPTQLFLLANLLERNGFHIERAVDGEEALSCARKGKPDLILSDIFMPKMDGYELCYALKQDSALRSIPVILLTTMSASESIVKALNTGADYFIPKPYDERYLVSKIKSILATRNLNGTLDQKETMEVVVDGVRHMVTSNRQQILNLLLSTYDAVVQKNNELQATQKVLEETQTQLIETQRLAAIAEVVSTICHEINNPLTAIMVPLQSRLLHNPPEIYKKDFEGWMVMLKRISAVVQKLSGLKASQTTSAGGEFKMIDLSLDKNLSSGKEKDIGDT
ncbi:MAG: response regulator [Ignavibacteriae bacterium]|nr:MAG: response regulator [Ignavibacteriota bacterium]